MLFSMALSKALYNAMFLSGSSMGTLVPIPLELSVSLSINASSEALFPVCQTEQINVVVIVLEITRHRFSDVFVASNKTESRVGGTLIF